MASLQGSGGGGALQERFKRFGQGLAVGPAEHGGQQQGLGRGARRDQHLATGQIADRIHIAVELAFLRQQTFHQGAVVAVLGEPLAQQMAEGAQGRQRIAQLMHQQAQLFILAVQAPLQPPLLQVEAERFGEAERHRLEALPQRLGPVAMAGFHLQGSEQQLLVAQRQPAPFFRGHP